MQDDEFKGSLSLSAKGNEAKFPDIPRPVLQALFREVSGDKDVSLKEIEPNKVVELQDIRTLIETFEQWVQPFETQVLAARVIVTHLDRQAGSKKTTLNFSSADSLLRYDGSNREPTDSCEVFLTALIRANETGLLHSFEASISLPSMISPQILDPFPDTYGPVQVVKIRISHTNFIIAQSLQSMIESWYEGLETVEFDRIPSLGKKLLFMNEEKIFNASRILINAFPLLAACSTLMAYEVFGSSAGLPNAISYLASIFVLSYLVWDALYRKALDIYKYRREENCPMLRFCRGDVDALARYEAETRAVAKSMNRELFGILTAYLVNIGAGITLWLWNQ